MTVLVQFASFVIWGAYFGTGAGMDVWMTSVALPMVLVVVTTGPLVSSLVPLLIEAKGSQDAAALVRQQNNLLNLFGIAGILVALLLFIASGLLMRLIAPGFNPLLQGLAAELLRIAAVSIPFSLCGGVLVSFFYAQERFLRPTLAPFFGGIAAIAVIVFGHETLGIHSLAWGMVANAAVQFFFMLGIVTQYSWGLTWNDEPTRKLARKMLPLSGGNMVYKSDSLVDRFILSFLPAGSISYLGYGQRMVTVISQVLSRGLVTTHFTELSAQGFRDRPAFRESLNRLFVRVCLVIAPIVVCLALFVRPALHYILRRGSFTSTDVQHTAAVILAFLGFLVGALLGSVMANAFYALGETKAITAIGVATFTIGIFLKIFLGFFLSYIGIALATSAYFLLAVVVEMVLLQRKMKIFSWAQTGWPVWKIMAAAMVAAIVGLLFKRFILKGMLSLLCGVLLTGAVYFLCSAFFGVIRREDLPYFLRKCGRENESLR